jgi:tetratricopeptide (TPR) repeat protein
VKFQYGYLARHIGDAGNALRQFGACLAGLDEAPELKSVLYGWTLFHKGVTLGYYPNRTEEALDCYLQAAAEFEDEGARDSLCHCLHNMAWLRLDTVDPALARELINQASPLCQDEHSTWRERVLLHYLAAVEGDFDEAQRLARWIEGEAPEDLRCLSLAIHANLCFDLGMTAPGMALANHAYDMAQNHQIDHRCYRVVLRALDRMNQARINTSGA